ncbi:MAG TPA: glycosyltransferase family 2 protein [Longimicrobiales bacterium]|nr:glycosyltransferase family 2 protein [Longimicrobiales bacterium]
METGQLVDPAEPAPARIAAAPAPLVSVVIPCLNEGETLASVLTKAREGILTLGLDAEIVVADNGSTDGSIAIAGAAGARVVHVPAKGYGHALMGGISAARGTFIIMGDADDSYDFRDIPRFVEKLREGYDLVQGCRLPAGGGRIAPGAMPFLHRWVGNPLLSFIAGWWFRAPVTDIYCGMRGFRKDLYDRLAQRCTGMEFATEMVVRSSLFGARIAEVPITLHRDGRQKNVPHLRTFRDGWRTLRFFLLYSPRWLFLVPGIALILLGLLGYAVAMPGFTLFGATFDAHTLLFASLFIICGYQAVLFGAFARLYAIEAGVLPASARLDSLSRVFNLERGLLLGGAAVILGVFLLGIAINQWRLASFGELDYAATMRLVIPGVTLTALGWQSILSSFFLSILVLRRG